eukprot:TRINITY_DN80781_c0_g1_i1.p1 TRINITY_DN80781_c0_g1~~TRINITY_DN80781_c0_g1_i1.p1  ORF type:complete len:525 (+),score=104.72 TRINITY_DN80781_c0_g1_i1:112-1575(+)
MASCDVVDGFEFRFNKAAPEFYPAWEPPWESSFSPSLLAAAAPDGGDTPGGTGRQRRGGATRRNRKGSACSEGTAFTCSSSAGGFSPALGPTKPEGQGCNDFDEAASSTTATRKGSSCSGGGGSRRGTSSLEAPGQVATLVVKNLALDLQKDTIVQFLTERGVPPKDVELHLDACGTFRGTAFVRYDSANEAKGALDKLGNCVELGGRRARIEIQKSKSLIGRRSLEAELPADELNVVRAEIEGFLRDTNMTEMRLPPHFNVQQRKYAHSLAERYSLSHLTSQGDSGEKFVLLSKARRIQMQEMHRLQSRMKAFTLNEQELMDMQHGPDTDFITAAVDPAGGLQRKLSTSTACSTATMTAGKKKSKARTHSMVSPASAPTPVLAASSPVWSALPSPLLPPGLEYSIAMHDILGDGMLQMLPPPGLSISKDFEFPLDDPLYVEVPSPDKTTESTEASGGEGAEDGGSTRAASVCVGSPLLQPQRVELP